MTHNVSDEEWDWMIGQSATFLTDRPRWDKLWNKLSKYDQGYLNIVAIGNYLDVNSGKEYATEWMKERIAELDARFPKQE